MSNEIRVTGNVGDNPVQKQVGDQTITELRMYCDEWRYDSDTEKYVSAGGEWYDVTIWKADLAKAVFTTIKKGARIQVLGHLKVNRYADKEQVSQVALQITADDVTHKLNRVESVVLRDKSSREPATTD